jgi:hypothetical protein
LRLYSEGTKITEIYKELSVSSGWYMHGVFKVLEEMWMGRYTTQQQNYT